jgi:hypothetical protein
MTTQTKVKLLANWLERDGANCQQHLDIAAMLRQQAAEIERLKVETLGWAKRSIEQDKEIECLKADNAALRFQLEKYIKFGSGHAHCQQSYLPPLVLDAAHAALEAK